MSDRKCVNCRHNIRIPKNGGIECYCEIDNDYISYVYCFEHWCRRWAKDHKFDKTPTVIEAEEDIPMKYFEAGGK